MIYFFKFYKISVFFCILSFLQTLSPHYVIAETPKNVVLRSRDQAGMFSIFFDVLSLVHQYELKTFDSIFVNFKDTGVYYSPLQGSNWWSYYFEPIRFGKLTGLRERVYGLEYSINPYAIEFVLPKQLVAHLVEKYVKVKPYILQEVQQFAFSNFSERYVIGIHYRGTDKNISEARRVAYAEVTAKIEEILATIGNSEYMLFLATDEWNFIDYMSEHYPNHICYVHEASRSTNGKPIHIDNEDPFLSGKYALIDCLLLSRTNFLIRTSSNLSLASTFFNPDLPVYELSRRNKPW